jgi:hypothetical protein
LPSLFVLNCGVNFWIGIFQGAINAIHRVLRNYVHRPTSAATARKAIYHAML